MSACRQTSLRLAIITALCLGLTSSLCATAETLPRARSLRVIYDSGTATPVRLLPSVARALARAHQSVKQAIDDATAKELARLSPVLQLPLVTDLTVASIASRPRQRRHDMDRLQPFFLVGSDSISVRWIEANRDALTSLGAVGFLIQADSLHDVETVIRAGAGLPIAPVPGALIARQFDLSSYPVLVTDTGILQ